MKKKTKVEVKGRQVLYLKKSLNKSFDPPRILSKRRPARRHYGSWGFYGEGRGER